MTRNITVFYRSHQAKALASAQVLNKKLCSAGLEVTAIDDAKQSIENTELIVVLGGDGTILQAAEMARDYDIPIMGVNLGHVGFLAEAEHSDLQTVAQRIIDQSYTVDKRLTLDVKITCPDGTVFYNWALNEAAILGVDRGHPARYALGVDGEAVSEFGADGLILSTPTGSTAYSFSAGGPVVWPNVQALEVVPLAGFGLFTRPLVVDPESVLEVLVLSDQRQKIEVWCDGRRVSAAAPGSTIRATKGKRPIRFARISEIPFSARLVAKFDLPVEGWRRKDD